MPIEAGGFSVSIEGFTELADALERLADSESVIEVLGSSAFQGGLIVVNDTKRRVPVDTGTLQRSYHAEYGEITATSVTVEVGTDVEYGKYVEFGTSKMPAQPHLRPALDENKDEIAKVITDTFVELAQDELLSRGPRGGVRK